MTAMSTITLRLNGEPYALDAACSAAELIARLSLGERRIAVEINEQIVPKSQLEATWLEDGDRVEIVHAIGGG